MMPRGRLLVLLPLCALLGGCAFYQKDFISHSVNSGKNNGAERGDEGAFYIDDDPLVRLRMGCYRQTRLGETVFPLVPLPVLAAAEPHDSIAAQSLTLTLTLSHHYRDPVELSSADVDVEAGGRRHPLALVGKERVEYRERYAFAGDLRYDQVREATLTFRLGEGKIRVYSLDFEERIRRNAHLDGGGPCGIRARKAFDDIARDRRILDFAESVTGPDLLLFTHLFCEPPASARVVPWDQDGPFWPVRALRSCTVWLAIDPARSRPDAAAGWSRMPVELIRGVNRNPLTDLAGGDFGRPW